MANFQVPSDLNQRMAQALLNAINSSGPLQSRGFGNPTAFIDVLNRGGRVDIDIFIEAADYLLYVSEGTGANSNDPSQSADTTKAGIMPRNILSNMTDSQEFEEIIGDVAQAWLDWYFDEHDIMDLPGHRVPTFQNIYINGLDLTGN